jgi:NAD(P)-dependent dehydrogenase (short-subunit alcohol dehydrogenase family)
LHPAEFRIPTSGAVSLTHRHDTKKGHGGMVDLKGAGVIVTGGASGLGEAATRRLAAAGANVVIADVNEERGKQIAAELGSGAEFVRCDVESDEEVEEVVRVAASRGPLRVAVNCGGRAGAGGRIVGRDGTAASHEGFSVTVESFLVGTFNVMRLAAAQMAKEDPLDDNERGVVIMTASIAAFDGQIGQAAYSAAKGGIVGLTLPAARDLAAIGVRVVTIAPGTFKTPAYSMMPDEMVEHLESLTPFPKRMGRPDEYAALVEHICTNTMLNGEVIRIDGAVRFPPK